MQFYDRSVEMLVLSVILAGKILQYHSVIHVLILLCKVLSLILPSNFRIVGEVGSHKYWSRTRHNGIGPCT